MKIVIPMSGIGKRFIDAGYQVAKPLIEVDGKPIIEHVVNMFPGEQDFIFICNSKHLKETNMREILGRIAPQGKIVEIAPHKKGPVFAVLSTTELIDDEEEIIVNYCDFSCFWDYHDFLKHTRARNADGCIPAYKNFHPHMLGSMNYAFMRDKKQWMIEIKEKEPFTDNRMQEYASSGTYYFKKGSYLKKYFKEIIEHDINLKGEYYVSLVYNPMVRDGLKISIFEIEHMLQWGAPGDLAEYIGWSSYFANILSFRPDIKYQNETINLIPLAGRGSRFVNEGYQDPKPLIEVSGKSMIVQASSYLPPTANNIFVVLKEHLDKYPLAEELKKYYPKSKFVVLDQVTEGQACTCELGLVDERATDSLFIAASDNGMIYDSAKFQSFVDDTTVDAVVFSFRHHSSSKDSPQMYGWIKTDTSDNVTGVSVKVPVSDDPYNDHAIVGAFYFKKVEYFRESLKLMQDKNVRVNGEFYVDSCLNELLEMNLKVKILEVDQYICWGTPNDLRTFEYWQSFFHKCNWHPYRLEKDPTLLNAKIKKYVQRYESFKQPNE